MKFLLYYFGYEIGIGLPLALYYYFKKWDIREQMGAIPRILRFFPLAGWFFRTLATKTKSEGDSVKGLLPQRKMTLGMGILLLYAVFGLIGFFVVSPKEELTIYQGDNILEGATLFFGDILLNIAILLYLPGLGLLYYFLVHLPAKRNEFHEEENRKWEAKHPDSFKE